MSCLFFASFAHFCSAADRVCPRQAFEGLDREGRGFLTAEGVKQVVGLDFDTEEVGRDAEYGADGDAELLCCWCLLLAELTTRTKL